MSRSKTRQLPERGLMPAKIVLTGDRRAGTSSLLRRFNHNVFNEEYRPEMSKIVRHTKNVYHARHDCYVTVQFLDIEGADVRTSLQCAQKAHSVAVVYDVTNRSSFELAQQLLDGINPRASSILVATKVDLAQHRRVSHKEGRLLARIHRVSFLETSALNDYNVDATFHYIVNTLPDEYLLYTDPEKTIALRQAYNVKHNQPSLCARCQCRIDLTDDVIDPDALGRPSLHLDDRLETMSRRSYDPHVTRPTYEHVRRRQHHSDSEQFNRKHVRLESTQSSHSDYTGRGGRVLYL